jgi:outer membrane receptor protein involved in Fe transport
VSWDYGAWSTTLRNDYVGKQSFLAQSGKIGGESYWGLNLAYQASKDWTIVFDVANLLDEEPSYVDDTRGSYAGFSPYFGDPYGRRYLISTRYVFK